MSRYIIYGAGAVGGVIGGGLALAGHHVCLIARGRHLEAIQEGGLRFHAATGRHTLEVRATDDPGRLDLEVEDVVILAMKTQDTEPALDRLARCAPPGMAVVCAQNGVENERRALRRFANVHGIAVYLPGTHLDPGVVVGSGSPVYGVLDIGRYPEGVDDTTERVAADLEASGFRSRADQAIMRYKYAKLRMNTGNALDAVSGRASRSSDLAKRAAREALEVFSVAGIDVATQQQVADRRAGFETVAVEGHDRGGSSSWQSLARGSGSIEADYLNGEIVLLGRRHGVATPVNQVLQQLANQLASEGRRPGSVPLEEVEQLVAVAEVA